METLNRYIDGGRKRDQTTDLRGIQNSDAEYGLIAQNRRRHARSLYPPSSDCRRDYGVASSNLSCILASSAKVALGYGALEAAYDRQKVIVIERG
jgi:hypothetical protein